MQRLSYTRLVTGLVCALALTPGLRSQTQIVGSNPTPGDSALLNINPDPFSVSTIGNAGGVLGMSGLDFQPGTGVLFGSTGFGDGGRLYTIEPSTGAATLVGPTGFDMTPGLAFHWDGTLYATGTRGGRVSDRLIRIDPATGAGVEVGLFGNDGANPIRGLDGLAAHPITGVLYGISGAGFADGTGTMFTIDRNTGRATKIGQIRNSGFLAATTVAGLAFDCVGELYASLGNRDGRIIKINLSSMTFNYLGDAAGGSVAGLAVLPVDPPEADAGEDQSTRVRETVRLDGTMSTGDGRLTYRWRVVSRPEGSVAEIDLFSPQETPKFRPDLPGVYVIELVVRVAGCTPSAPDTVTVTARDNAAPTANAGSDAIIGVDQTLQLDGTGSSDPDDDPIEFSWSITSAPIGSSAELVGSTTATPSLTPDVAGSYVIELVVNDGLAFSFPSTIEIEALVTTVYVERLLCDLDAKVASLPPSAFDQGKHDDPEKQAKHGLKTQKKVRKDLNKVAKEVSKLTKAADKMDAKKIAKEKKDALRRLDKVIERTDGVALRGEPDVKQKKVKGEKKLKVKEDRIVDPAASVEVFNDLQQIVTAVNAVQ